MKLITTILQLFTPLITRWVYYYDGQLYRYARENDNFTLAPVTEQPNNIPLLIVGRKFYRESYKEYPLDNRKELTKLLELEVGNKRLDKYQIWRKKEGKSKVNWWNFSEHLPKSLCYLPESLLIAKSMNKGELAEVSFKDKNSSELKQKQYIASHQGVVFSSLSQGVINSAERFAMSVGLPEYRTVELDQFEISSSFANAGNLVSHLKTIVDFSYVEKSNWLTKLHINVTLPIVIGVSLYLTLSTLYLQVANWQLNSAYKEQKELISQTLREQIELDESVQNLDSLSQFLSDKTSLSQYWLVIHEMLPHAKLTNFGIRGEYFVVAGTADKATNVLEVVSQLQIVDNAKFLSSTRRSGNKERFSIGFQLKDKEVK